jgi:hypothetical protein
MQHPRPQLGQVRPRALLVSQARNGKQHAHHLGQAYANHGQRGGAQKQQLQGRRTRHTAGFAADGGKGKHVEAQPVPSQPSPGLGMKGLLLLKWLVWHCALADQPWAVRPQASTLVPASELAVEVVECDECLSHPDDYGHKVNDLTCV